MDSIYSLLLTVHIIGGLTALATGYGAMVVKRGGPRHRSLGKFYVRGMLLVLLSGLPMSILHPNPFLFGVVFFSAYFVWAGRSAAVTRQGAPTIDDKIALGIFLAGALIALMTLGLSYISALNINPTHQITGVVFAIIAMSIGMADLRLFRTGPIAGKARIQRHLINMCAGLIATTTAVLVTLAGYLPNIPALIAWLGPTFIITPLIIYWSRQVVKGTYKF